MLLLHKPAWEQLSSNHCQTILSSFGRDIYQSSFHFSVSVNRFANGYRIYLDSKTRCSRVDLFCSIHLFREPVTFALSYIQMKYWGGISLSFLPTCLPKPISESSVIPCGINLMYLSHLAQIALMWGPETSVRYSVDWQCGQTSSGVEVIKIKNLWEVSSTLHSQRYFLVSFYKTVFVVLHTQTAYHKSIQKLLYCQIILREILKILYFSPDKRKG